MLYKLELKDKKELGFNEITLPSKEFLLRCLKEL